MPVKYDSALLQKYAIKLQHSASSFFFWTVAAYTFTGFLIGAGFGFLYGITQHSPDSFAGATALATVLAFGWGLRNGRVAAFARRVQSQQILAQLQIERNTRQAKAAQA